MNRWAGLPTPRWMTDFRNQCDVEQTLKEKLNVTVDSPIAFKDALQKNAEEVYQSELRLSAPEKTEWCPMCKEGNGGLIDSMRPKQDRGGNQTEVSIYPWKAQGE